MAKRTLPLDKFSLGTLIKHFDIKVESRHRAMDDAYAAAVILMHLLKKDENGNLYNKEVNRGVRESLLPPGISLETLHALPEVPGVYYFMDSTTEIVYIGKSKNIQKRVMSHFTKTTRKAEKLQQRVNTIDFVETGNDLLAQITEAHEIKKHRPEINRAQRSASFQHMLVARKNSLGYLRFDLTVKPKQDDEILNAYPTKKSGFSMLNYIVNEFGLCPLYTHLENGMGPCSLHQYGKCHGACIHEEEPDVYNERALAALEFANNRFERDFVMTDIGRNINEKSVVFVENGEYQGHGFFDVNQAMASPEDLKDHIKKMTYYPEINSMIRRYIDQGGGEKIWYL